MIRNFDGKISAQPHTTLCIQFLDRENNNKNNTLPFRKQICFSAAWAVRKFYHFDEEWLVLSCSSDGGLLTLIIGRGKTDNNFNNKSNYDGTNNRNNSNGYKNNNKYSNQEGKCTIWLWETKGSRNHELKGMNERKLTVRWSGEKGLWREFLGIRERKQNGHERRSIRRKKKRSLYFAASEQVW